MVRQASVLKFLEVTGADMPEVATFFLHRNNGKINEAVNDFFLNPRAAKDIERQGERSERKVVATASKELKAILDTYKEAQPDAADRPYIGVDGTMQYLEDLGYAPEDAVVLALAEFLESPTVGVFKEEPFLRRWASVGANSLGDMKNHVKTLERKLDSDPEYFRKVYQFAYKFILEKNEKNMALDMAEEYWQLLIPKQYGAELDRFLQFMHKEGKQTVTRDQWNMLLPFLDDLHQDPNLDNYNESQSWPLLMDEFYEYLTE